MHPPWHTPFIQVGIPPRTLRRVPPLPLTPARLVFIPPLLFSLPHEATTTSRADQERETRSNRVRERESSSSRRRQDVELGLRPRRAARAAVHAPAAAAASSAPSPPARCRPAPCQPPRHEHRRCGGGGRATAGSSRGGGGGGRVARAAAAAGGVVVAAAGVAARGGGCCRRGGGRRAGAREGRERRRRGEGAEPDRRRPGGAQGVRGSGVRLQLQRDPRALQHPARARALLLHEPALPRRAPAPAWQARGVAGAAGSGLAGAARRHQLEDLQPWGQPGRGEGEAQVLGAGSGVHRQALQLIHPWRLHNTILANKPNTGEDNEQLNEMEYNPFHY